MTLSHNDLDKYYWQYQYQLLLTLALSVTQKNIIDNIGNETFTQMEKHIYS